MSDATFDAWIRGETGRVEDTVDTEPTPPPDPSFGTGGISLVSFGATRSATTDSAFRDAISDAADRARGSAWVRW